MVQGGGICYALLHRVIRVRLVSRVRGIWYMMQGGYMLSLLDLGLA